MKRQLLATSVVSLAIILGACGNDESKNNKGESSSATEVVSEVPDNVLVIDVEGEKKEVEANIEVLSSDMGSVKMKVPTEFEASRNTQRDSLYAVGEFEGAYMQTSQNEDDRYELKIQSYGSALTQADGHRYIENKEFDLEDSKDFPKLKDIYDYHIISIGSDYNKYIFTVTYENRMTTDIVFDVPVDKVNSEIEAMIYAMVETVEIQ